MSLDYNIIGERIKNARLQNKLTQEKLAEKLDISVAYLSRVERGDAAINLKRLNQICELLNVTEGEILNGVSHTSTQYLSKDFALLFENCPPEKLKLIYNLSRIIIDDKEI